jgi:lysophospholipase L1-like esterase
VGILPYDQRGFPQTFLPATQPPPEQTSDWSRFTQHVTLASDCSCFGVLLKAEGEGMVWLDDVQLSGDKVETVPADPDSIAPSEHQEPERPYPGTGKQRHAWIEAQRALQQKAHTANPAVVFIGDSITHNWQVAGHAEWERYFEPLGALNLGMGGDRTSQILWRIQAGTLAGLHPKVVVLGVGINNLLRDTYSPERVAKGILTCVHAIEHACPGARVLVVGIFPTPLSPAHPMRTKIRSVNALLAAQLPHFLDLGSAFLEPDGTLNERVLYDSIHPSDYGYTLYRERLYPRIQSLLKP